MIEKKEKRRSQLSTRDLGYVAAMIILGIALGLLLYPLLTYPALWQWGALLLSLVLMALTAPAL